MIAAGTPGFELMTRAGRALHDQVNDMLPAGGVVLLLCGPGNNGGDGYVLARLLLANGFKVRVMRIATSKPLIGDAARAEAEWREVGGKVEDFQGHLSQKTDLIVDALFGIGLERPVAHDFHRAIAAINHHPAPVLSVDIPSGIHSDTGLVMGAAVNADTTLTFLGLKLGLFIGDGGDVRGELLLDGLGGELEAGEFGDAIMLIPRRAASSILPKRCRSDHKGLFGHVAVVGGDEGMSGAVRMAGEAALRAGAGLVTVATHPAHAGNVNITRPELMSIAVHGPNELARALRRATVVAIGPGMVDSVWSWMCWEAIAASDCPKVVDAGALALLARFPGRVENRVLTPHPGEAAQLLDISTAEVQADRPGAAQALYERYGGVAVLKGAGTLVAGAKGLALCDEGNPGMATGGMGDVLTGLIAGLIAQGLDINTAAELGVQIHARAGDLAAAPFPRGLLATDLMRYIRELVNR